MLPGHEWAMHRYLNVSTPNALCNTACRATAPPAGGPPSPPSQLPPPRSTGAPPWPDALVGGAVAFLGGNSRTAMPDWEIERDIVLHGPAGCSEQAVDLFARGLRG